ncbi:MAG: hypothetical protein AB7L13_20530 [Acidimicrobiia bacterium]
MTVVRGRGLEVAVPSGWDVRIYRREPVPPEQTFTIMHVANFGLPERVGDYGGGAVNVMKGSSIFLCLLEFDPLHVNDALFAYPGPPSTVPIDYYATTTLQHGLPGQVGAQLFFNAGERAWSLFVVLGNSSYREISAPQVDQILQSLVISRFG